MSNKTQELIDRVIEILAKDNPLDYTTETLLEDCKAELERLSQPTIKTDNLQRTAQKLFQIIDYTATHSNPTQSFGVAISNELVAQNLKVKVSALFAELERLQKESEWHDISTAPKDKWIIVGSEDGEIAIAKDYIYIGISKIPKAMGWVSDAYDGRGEHQSLWFTPAHWMPLPKAPEGV
jgi:hypothetical protein